MNRRHWGWIFALLALTGGAVAIFPFVKPRARIDRPVTIRLAPPPVLQAFRMRVLGHSPNLGCAVRQLGGNAKLTLHFPEDADRQLVAFDAANDRRDYRESVVIPRGSKITLDPGKETYLQYFWDVEEPEERKFFRRDGLYLLVISTDTDEMRENIRIDGYCRVFLWRIVNGPAKSIQGLTHLSP